MHQVVIYLKSTGSELVYQDSFEIPGTRHQFQVIRLWEQPEEIFWQSRGLLPLAVLSQTEDRRETLKEVAQRIEQIEERRERSNVAASAAILAGLVLEKEVIGELLRSEVMRESVIYQEIKAEGRAEGIAEGEAKGRVEGKQEGEVSLILRFLRKRIGEISQDLEKQIQTLSIEQLEELSEALLDFTTEADLVDWLKNFA